MAIAIAALLAPLSLWYYRVNSVVVEPYLDEVFHVRQAQVYCDNRFWVWDPKITTPPGLYFISYFLSKTEFLIAKLGLPFKLPLPTCDLTSLRAANFIGLVLLLLVIRTTYLKRAVPAAKRHPGLLEHSSLNIVLFPPLFFFSALYYTDVWSALFTLLFYVYLPNPYSDRRRQLWWFVRLVIVGLVSLAFRQTNVFWITVFPAAILLVQQIDRGSQAIKHSMYRGVEGFGDSLYSIAKASWKHEVIYDPPVRDAWIADYLNTAVSIVACALKVASQPKRLVSLLGQLAPFITLSGCFAAFVVWNGGVVLGDRSNHIVTMHVPQVLYIWPFIAFFSWPALYPYLFLLSVSILATVPLAVAPLESMQILKRRTLLPRMWISLAAVGLAGGIVLVNTVVHPFTTADNRHYIFYVFRHLLRPWWVRYAVTPIYVLCGWSCIEALGGGPPHVVQYHRKLSNTKPSLALPNGQNSANTSFALIWIGTSALQLVTAPLVEPRYFILPWVFWRMHLPLETPAEPPPHSERSAAGRWSGRLWEGHDHRLWMETAWLLIVNAVTGYVFLNWGFEWPQEPGKVQRFMW